MFKAKLFFIKAWGLWGGEGRLREYILLSIRSNIMYNLQQLEKQQIGLRPPKYLIEEQKEKFLFEKELLTRVSDIKNKKLKPLSRNEVFDGL